ncbi:Cap-specific mRNA (nucleoside-2-O-) methyltransferase 1, putative [Bodo saltans]|uniref:Cap-specific mRNA (nucleoside-2'-O-)-methyltransferase 1 n=1 Tax=Bodo saltans TaxID=75058 RepID=A0A0S4IIT9_BODSA|nr:Cap-specific mRNA (nucleoside-2-O-) methyltransferase 1, putative [Bodo saltans]|eukprot:CUE73123.1 Cap-specific mRNA (nucleoside-2-O-) methyltransferase 1, putative [Bodo saltans]
MATNVVCDKTVEFELTSSFHLTDDDVSQLWGGLQHNVHWRSAFDDVLLSTRVSLNGVKKQLDTKDLRSYHAARDALFPLATSGTQGATTFRNRAGYKLMESMEVTGVWEQVTKLCKQNGWRQAAFADVCGGPGAFSQALYATVPKYFSSKRSIRGYGMTLLNEGDDTLQWYPNLTGNKQFFVLHGTEGTGNIYPTENLHSLMAVTRDPSWPLLLVVADGGFDVPFDVAEYQEAISLRIVYGQWVSAVLTLMRGGCLVLKLFDTFTPFLRSMLYLSTALYDRVHIVKPKHSRVVNSERYLVCLGFRGCSASMREYLLKVHEEGFGEDTAPFALVPHATVSHDAAFCAQVEAFNATLASTQSQALQMVLASPLLTEAAGSGAAIASAEAEVSTPVAQEQDDDAAIDSTIAAE